MAFFDQPVPLSEGAKLLAQKKAWPTALKTADIQELDADFLRRSNFSAQTTMEGLLDLYKDLLTDIVAPTTEQRDDRITPENPQGNVTTGPSVATARESIQSYFTEIGYKPEEGTAGTLLDLSSFPRIMLKLTTDMATAFGGGRFVRQNADPLVVQAYPGLSFERTRIPKGGVDAERDWPARWLAAAAQSGDDQAAKVFRSTGEMIALKSSGIWQALGDGTGGYDDTLGNPYDPIAFNTGMRQFEVAREKMEELGFLDEGEQAEAAPLSLLDLFDGGAIKNRVTGKTVIANGDYDGHPFHGNQWTSAGVTSGHVKLRGSQVVRESDKAVLARVKTDEGTMETWLPKSHASVDEHGTVHASSWIIEQKEADEDNKNRYNPSHGRIRILTGDEPAPLTTQQKKEHDEAWARADQIAYERIQRSVKRRTKSGNEIPEEKEARERAAATKQHAMDAEYLRQRANQRANAEMPGKENAEKRAVRINELLAAPDWVSHQLKTRK